MTSVHTARKHEIRARRQESDGTRALRAWVQAQGVSMKRCAMQLGIRPVVLSDWLRGAVPYLDNRLMLEAVANISPQAWPKHRAPRRADTRGKEETGKIGKLTIGPRVPGRGCGAVFRCVCECGVSVDRLGTALRTARKRGLLLTCGSKACRTDPASAVYAPGPIGRVVVEELIEYAPRDLSLYRCRCACGATFTRRKRGLEAARIKGNLAMCRECLPKYNRAKRAGGSALDAWRPLRSEAAE